MPFLEENLFSKLSPYLIAMLMGLLIGIEREKRTLHVQKAMGVRSFLVIALVGALAGGLKQPLLAFGLLLFVAAAITASYVRTSKQSSNAHNHIGITTELSAMATFGLGYFSHSEPFLSLALSIALLLFLHNKTILHNFIRSHLKQEEIQAAGILLLLAVGVVPLLPNETVDPLHIFNPFRLGLIIALIAAIEFSGYVVSRVFGSRIGLPVSGFLAGLISSTAAFASLPEQAKEKPKNYLAIASAAAFAVCATVGKLPIIIGAISLRLMVALFVPLLIVALASGAIGVILARKQTDRVQGMDTKNPLRIVSALKMGALLMALILVVELTQRYLGPTYTTLVTFLAGLFELDAVIIAGANLFEIEGLTLRTAGSNIFIAIIASLLSKIVLTAVMARELYRIVVLTFLSILLCLSIGILLLIYFFPQLLISFS